MRRVRLHLLTKGTHTPIKSLERFPGLDLNHHRLSLSPFQFPFPSFAIHDGAPTRLRRACATLLGCRRTSITVVVCVCFEPRTLLPILSADLRSVQHAGDGFRDAFGADASATAATVVGRRREICTSRKVRGKLGGMGYLLLTFLFFVARARSVSRVCEAWLSLSRS